MNAPSAAPSRRMMRITVPQGVRREWASLCPIPGASPMSGQPSIATGALVMLGFVRLERPFEGLAQRPHGDHLDPVDRPGLGPPRPARGTIARVKPSRAASRRRRSRPLTERSSPSSPTSPMATVPGRTGRSRNELARAIASGRSRAGLVEDQAAGQVGVHVVAAQADPGPPAEDRDQQGQPVLVEAAGGPAGRAVGRRAVSAWTSTRSGRLSLPGSARRRCPEPAIVLGEERPGRVAQGRQPALAHLQDADLLGRAEAVLGGAQQAQGGE
jgi:hypothetical protein